MDKANKQTNQKKQVTPTISQALTKVPKHPQ